MYSVGKCICNRYIPMLGRRERVSGGINSSLCFVCVVSVFVFEILFGEVQPLSCQPAILLNVSQTRLPRATNYQFRFINR